MDVAMKARLVNRHIEELPDGKYRETITTEWAERPPAAEAVTGIGMDYSRHRSVAAYAAIAIFFLMAVAGLTTMVILVARAS